MHDELAKLPLIIETDRRLKFRLRKKNKNMNASNISRILIRTARIKYTIFISQLSILPRCKICYIFLTNSQPTDTDMLFVFSNFFRGTLFQWQFVADNWQLFRIIGKDSREKKGEKMIKISFRKIHDKYFCLLLLYNNYQFLILLTSFLIIVLIQLAFLFYQFYLIICILNQMQRIF